LKQEPTTESTDTRDTRHASGYGKNVSGQALGRIVYMVAGFAFFAVIARMFGPGILGHFAWASAFLYVATTFADLSSTGAFALMLGKTTDHRELFYGNFLIIRGALAAIVTAISAPVAYWLAPEPVRLPLMLMCLLLPLIAARFFDPIFQIHHRPWLTLWLSVTYAIVLLVGGITAFLVSEHHLFWIIIAFGTAGAAYGLSGLIVTFRMVRPKLTFKRQMLVEMVQVIGPVGVSSFFSLINTRLDIFFLEAMRTPVEVGQYNAAFRFLDLGAAVAVTLMTPLLPILGSLAINDRDLLARLYRILLQWTVIIGVAVAVMTPLLSHHVLLLAFGEAFDPAAIVLDILSWKFVLACINILTFGTLISMGSVNFAYWNTAAASVMNILLNIALIPDYGITGAAIATLISEVFLVGVAMVVLHRSIGSVFNNSWWLWLASAATAMFAVEWLLRPMITVAPALLVGLMTFIGLLYFTKALPAGPKSVMRAAENKSVSASTS
jgi:O-antigen/teichoic acid export membrane protein